MRFNEFLNKQMYDLSSDEGRRQYEDDLKWYQNFKNRPKITEVERIPQSEASTVLCWRGSSLEHLERMASVTGSGYRILNPQKSRSGVLWFAHSFQGHDARDYAVNEAGSDGVIITYPLKVTLYFDIVKYSDGSESHEPNEEKSKLAHPFSESPLAIFGNNVVQPPQGWMFSEHREKHLLCELPLRIDDSMLEYV